MTSVEESIRFNGFKTAACAQDGVSMSILSGAPAVRKSVKFIPANTGDFREKRNPAVVSWIIGIFI